MLLNCHYKPSIIIVLHSFWLTNQATILISVVVRVHANLGNDKDADHTEDNIIARFKDILKAKSLDEASRILEDIDLTIIAAKKGHSVVLYVYCRTATELTNLYEMNLSGKLNSIIELVFRQLLLSCSTAKYAKVTIENPKDIIVGALTQQIYRSQLESLTVTLPMTEYKKCISYFCDGKYSINYYI